MMKEINDDTLLEFIGEHLNIEDFGYLIIPDDARLNDEALSKIKADFKEFLQKS